jgi:uncharacterized protein YbjT (DUF2867 family)
MGKKAIIIGATGLVGSHILRLLLENPIYEKVTILVRRKIELAHPKLNQQIFDFEHPDNELIKTNEIYCAIGTTIKKAGSKEAQYHIDCEIPTAIAKIAKANNVTKFLLVSSLGANAQSSNFYLQTKGDLEQKIAKLNFKSFISARPSIILGERNEQRFGEKIGILLAKAFKPILLGSLKKYAGIEASDIAKALIKMANEDYLGNYFIESDKLKNIAKL